MKNDIKKDLQTISLNAMLIRNDFPEFGTFGGDQSDVCAESGR
jgi:hypothetical protein